MRSDPKMLRAFSMHDRAAGGNQYVYPVISRRSKGLSIGVNLNPDKVCNFGCLYCSVNRTVAGGPRPVDQTVLRREVALVLRQAMSGEIYRWGPFAGIDPEYQRLNDIAFSGDGEPTTRPDFGQCCRIVAEELESAGLSTVKVVLITNATMLSRQHVRDALAFLDRHNGEIWAKLDAGTDEHYAAVNRTVIPFSRVLANLAWCTRIRPTVIQTMLLRVRNQPPSPAQVQAYTERLQALRRAGGMIRLVQLYTVARNTAERYVTALPADELAAIARHVALAIPGIKVEAFA